MKQYIALSGLLLFSILNASVVKLDHPILASIDGRNPGVNGEAVGLIKKYQSDIMNIVMGKLSVSGERVGWYEFEAAIYNLQDLRKKEDELGSNLTQNQKNQLKKILTQMKADVEKISIEFEHLSRAAKPVIALLVEESCEKRHRQNSLLLTWAHSHESEHLLFDKHITSVHILEIFLVDLYNFLSDFVHSCPKAYAQFEERLAKFGQCKKLINQFPDCGPEAKKQFLKYVHQFLDKLHLNDITEDTIKNMFNSFKQQLGGHATA